MLQAKDRDAVRSCFSFEFQLCVLISFFFFAGVCGQLLGVLTCICEYIPITAYTERSQGS